MVTRARPRALVFSKKSASSDRPKILGRPCYTPLSLVLHFAFCVDERHTVSQLPMLTQLELMKMTENFLHFNRHVSIQAIIINLLIEDHLIQTILQRQHRR